MSEQQHSPVLPSITDEELLENNEVVLIVDDFPDIVSLLQEFVQDQGFTAITAGSAADLQRQLEANKVALVLLDIGLPDADGMELIPELKNDIPDLSIIMLTAVTDLQTALACLRHGADDYLTKPVHFTNLLSTLRKVLEKRRLTINNRRYQKQIEQARFRIQLAHELAMKMNTAYLSMVELDEILHAILVGITAEEGLQFNRAFLALFDEQEQFLEGRLAIGPDNREDGGRIWDDIQKLNMGFEDLIEKIRDHGINEDSAVNRIVRALKIDATDDEHILIHAVRQRKPINVVNGQCELPVPIEFVGLLQEDCFVVVPLYSSNRSLGVIIADHFITRRPITEDRIHDLESFASQASLAIEHCHLYMAMDHKIQELEAMAYELEKNKDMLVEAERYSAVGHMAAQLAHNIRNPITSIGGTARLLTRKTADPEWHQFLAMMTSEAEKIERTLEDLFSFVDQVKPSREEVALNALIHKAVILHFNALKKNGITQELILPEKEPVLEIDQRLIHQMLVHLIRNSIEAMPDGGELLIEVQLEEEVVKIIIRDTGIGIVESNLAHTTDPFFTTKIFGTGMGLTLVKRIVEDHQGHFILQRRKRGGMEAVVTLPNTGVR